MSISSAVEYCEKLSPYIEEGGLSKENAISLIDTLMHDHYANECFSEGGEGSRYVSTTRPEMNGIPTLDLDGGAVEIYCRHENNETSLGIRAKFAAVQYYENYDHLFYRCYNDKESCGKNGAYLEQPYYTCFNGALDENGCTGFTSDVIYFDKDLEFTEKTLRRIPAKFTRKMAIELGDELIKTFPTMYVYYDYDYIGRGHLSTLSPRTLSNAYDFCEYIIEEHQRKITPSINPTSSSAAVSSSSIEVQQSSSSKAEFSSSLATNVFDGIVNNPDQIFNSGLQNMEEGSCYSLNHARANEFNGWVNDNASDSWWWREVDCNTGNRIDKNKIGACPGFPLDEIPSNPTSACFAYNGTCYKCNPSRGGDCGNSWLWSGSFSYGNIGWWYVEIDCYTSLQKQAPYGQSQDITTEETFDIDFTISQKNFDILGRRKNSRPTAKQIIYRTQKPF